MHELISQYGYLAVFVFAGFDHSGTPLGVLLSIGFVTTGELSLFPTLVIATLGGIFGDLALYSIGFLGGNKALQWFKKKNRTINSSILKAESGLKKHGAVFLIWGRFITFVGRYMALVYGSIQYKLSSFIFFSSIGGILVTCAFGLPAYFIGSKANEIVHDQNFTLYITLGLILVQIIGASIWAKYKNSKL